MIFLPQLEIWDEKEKKLKRPLASTGIVLKTEKLDLILELRAILNHEYSNN